MKDIPQDRRYTKEHEWARKQGELIEVGITAYAVEQLGDVTLVDLPEAGISVQATERFGDLESVKTVSELFAPISGEIVDVNHALRDRPELVNDGPYDAGWMVRVRPAQAEELQALMDAEQYAAFLDTLDH